MATPQELRQLTGAWAQQRIDQALLAVLLLGVATAVLVVAVDRWPVLTSWRGAGERGWARRKAVSVVCVGVRGE